ncbi:alpha/beta hydrolase [Lacticaseibacillus mingshuiensis]|uniref:Alpha/beta hydrolase n=2 Tax=Lacticaseibacillus mingshuiensis TaxID=2799574 RepID=A0ABW4CFE5_9LACO|nr:alpha/beta hydrolase [Lacticaseibacillus mingshuiensis]
MQLIHETLTTPLSSDAVLDGYIRDASANIEPNRKRIAVIICPGGAYSFVADREAEPVALALLARGQQAFVLHYSVGPARPFPTALLELAAAVRLVRTRAAEWAIDPDKIIVAGFSAGGHLAASLADFWHTPALVDHVFSPADVQPNGLMLAYPVITSGPHAHRGSFRNLLGDQPTPDQLEAVSLEKHVSAQNPPTFLWSTFADDAVPVENSLLLDYSPRYLGHEIASGRSESNVWSVANTD